MTKLQNRTPTDLILVGCVKTKIGTNDEVRAKDLYDSPLWRCRRKYAEGFGGPWYILSAKHHLLDPEKKIRTYNQAMSNIPAERREWSQEVMNDIKAKFPDLRGKVVEIHAGKHYAESGLERKLRAAGAVVHRPLERLGGIEFQRAWYRECLASDRSSALEETERTSFAARIAQTIVADFYDEKSRRWKSMPEVECARRLRARGEKKRTVRLFLTFVSAMDRARNAGSLWEKGFELFKSNPELFDPAQVAEMPFEEFSRLLKESGVSRCHEKDVRAWRRIAENLRPRSLSSVRRVIDGGVGNAAELLEDLRGCDRKGEPLFPLLRGPKIGPMWVCG